MTLEEAIRRKDEAAFEFNKAVSALIVVMDLEISLTGDFSTEIKELLRRERLIGFFEAILEPQKQENESNHTLLG